jgi:hypothetical protein
VDETSSVEVGKDYLADFGRWLMVAISQSQGCGRIV